MSTKVEWVARPDTIPEMLNITAGCTKYGLGCHNCYAIPNSWRMAHNPKAPERYHNTVRRRIVDGKLDWTGTINVDEEELQKVKGWRKERTAFVCGMSDLFHYDVPAAFIQRAIEVFMSNPDHTFILCTKRADRLRHIFNFLATILGTGTNHRWPNVWALASCSSQPEILDKLDDCLHTPLVGVRGLSLEPYLAPVDLKQFMPQYGPSHLEWVILGCESGPRRRLGAFETWDQWWDSARAVVRQCNLHGVPVFVKQIPKLHEASKLGWRVSRDPSEWPYALRERRWPDGK